MTARRLAPERVEKVWGRRDLAPWFADVEPGHAPVGEIWFAAPGDPALMCKFLFTSERLSIQVHPDDAAARQAGYPRGKDEAWVVLAAEPHATIGLGLKRAVSPAELRAAALDGSIEALLDWRPVKAGDVIYSPARTVHAIGAGVTLVEVQQNLDLTYRLYDYGRPRGLHLDEAIGVARPEPFNGQAEPLSLGGGRTRLASGAAFTLERWEGAGSGEVDVGCAWVTVLRGPVRVGAADAHAGECWMVERGVAVERGEGSELLVACPA